MRVPELKRRGFTLIELMVVVALIGILIGGVFKLVGAASGTGARSRTIERLQRVENALSGFYSEYGTYPPVPRQGSPDPFVEEEDDGTTKKVGDLTSANAERAARSQPMSFEFPSQKKYDNFINKHWAGTAVSANQNPQGFDNEETDWSKLKLFRYGVLSFLLPRVRVMCELNTDGKSIDWSGKGVPQDILFEKQQWKQYNSIKNKLGDQLTRESVACARWLPNLEGIVHGGFSVMGVGLAQPNAGAPQFAGPYKSGGGQAHVLGRMTIKDGYDNELYYLSTPPYQSYRIWSAGPNGKTFPPDYPMQALTESQRQLVTEWIKDDIVGFDR